MNYGFVYPYCLYSPAETNGKSGSFVKILRCQATIWVFFMSVSILDIFSDILSPENEQDKKVKEISNDKIRKVFLIVESIWKELITLLNKLC